MENRDDANLPGPSFSPDRPQEVGSESPTQVLSSETVASEIGGENTEAAVPLRKPGLGLIEAVIWLVGLQVAQVVAGLVSTAALTAWFIWNGGVIDTLQSLIELSKQSLPEILVGAQVGSVLFGIGAILWRGRTVDVARVGWNFPGWARVMAITVAAVPLSILCSSLQAWAFHYSPDSHAEMTELFASLKGASPWSLLFAIALAPALAEEFVFRGVIGRGLVARWGVVFGVVVTSLLFAIAHLNPAQSLGVLPMGLALHFTYLTTRSIWAPVLLHFLNNGLAVLLLTMAPQVASEMDQTQGIQAELLLVSAAVVLGVALFLWETRASDEDDFDQQLGSGQRDLAVRLAAAERMNEPSALGWVTAGLVFNGLGFLAVLSRNL